LQTLTDPPALTLLHRDEYTYLAGPDSAWGMREALAYLEENGQRVDGQIPTIAVIKHCGSVTLHVTDDFLWTCIDDRGNNKRIVRQGVSGWMFLAEKARTWPFLYVITDLTEYVPLDTPPTDTPFAWELVFTYQRPNGGGMVAVWYLHWSASAVDSVRD
jgi:hypothetical protein